MAENNNGKGTTKLKTSEQHEAARRAAKAKQRRNRHHGQTDSGFTVRSEATPRVDKNMRAKTQAEEARRIIVEGNLTPGSLAYKLAMAIIDGFSYATSEGRKSKTSVAIGEACRQLTAVDRRRQAAVRLGIKCARAALFDAGNLIHAKGLVYHTESASR